MLSSESKAAAETVATGAHPSVLVVVEGELDVATCDGLCARVLRVAAGRRRVLLDLRAVSFVDMCGARALGALCDELAHRQVDAHLILSAALERLLERLADVGAGIALPVAPPVLDADAYVVSLTLTPAARLLRPVESRVLRLLDEGLTPTEVAFRFQRSVRWVEQVAAVGRRRLGERAAP